MRPPPWRIGQIAKRTGLSVRTLHWYDEIGLLTPSFRGESGYRLYTAADVARLQQIVSLRQLGFALEEVRACLDSPDFSPLTLIQRHLAHSRDRMEAQRRLCDRLEFLAAHWGETETVSVEELLQTIEEMNVIAKYYSPEQLEQLKVRGEQVGKARIRQVEDEWPKLMDEVRTEMEKGSDPSSEVVQALARRWMSLIHEFTGGDAGIEKSLQTMYSQEQSIHGTDLKAMQPMMDYIGKAWAAAK